MSVSGCGFPGVCPAFPGADKCAADTEETGEGGGGIGADQGQSAALLPQHHDEGTAEGVGREAELTSCAGCRSGGTLSVSTWSLP